MSVLLLPSYSSSSPSAAAASSSTHTMTTSILLRPPSCPHSATPSPAPSSNELSSSSSGSSTSGSYLELHRSTSIPSTRRIRFAPLPDPRRDDDLSTDNTSPTHHPQTDPKTASQSEPSTDLLEPGLVSLSPSISPESSLSSAQSTHTIRPSQNQSSPYYKPSSAPTKSRSLLRPLSFLRRSRLPSPPRSPISQSASLPASRNTSPASLARASTSVPSSPVTRTSILPRLSAEDVLTLGTISFFRSRSGLPVVIALKDPLPLLPNTCKTATHSIVHPLLAQALKRRASSSALTPGAGGGRHVLSSQMLGSSGGGRSGAASAPPAMKSSPLAPPKQHVKMLNGRIYGAKRYAAQTLANPFANVREEPEFVEWGYGGMGSVDASAGLGSNMWRGLQRGERGGALLTGSSFDPSSSSSLPGKEVRPTATSEENQDVTVGGGRGSGAHVRTTAARRRIMSNHVPESQMGSVGAGGADEEDGSGMGWVKKRRAEKDAKARLEREAREREEAQKEKRKSGDSGMDASMSTSTMSTSTTLTTSASDVTTPGTSPLTSRSTSVTDLNLASSVARSASSSSLTATPLYVPSPPATDEQSPTPVPTAPAAYPTPTLKDEHHVLRAVRLSPHLAVSHTHSHSNVHVHGHEPSLSLSQVRRDDDAGEVEGDAPLSPVDTVETTSSSSSSEEVRAKRDSDEDGEQYDEEDEDESQASHHLFCHKTGSDVYAHDTGDCEEDGAGSWRRESQSARGGAITAPTSAGVSLHVACSGEDCWGEWRVVPCGAALLALRCTFCPALHLRSPRLANEGFVGGRQPSSDNVQCTIQHRYAVLVVHSSDKYSSIPKRVDLALLYHPHHTTTATTDYFIHPSFLLIIPVCLPLPIPVPGVLLLALAGSIYRRVRSGVMLNLGCCVVLVKYAGFLALSESLVLDLGCDSPSLTFSLYLTSSRLDYRLHALRTSPSLCPRLFQPTLRLPLHTYLIDGLHTRPLVP
ncbi:hypothetical protein BU15DRAFT_74551 [Melanogaster broomeanus]|nr:hypothetical protein BU15DRAFT_74551 [Melanogaster broomeanus]